MAEQNRTPHTRTASYLAEPGEVGRVLLLYSGGLDTSVMLKSIQDEYEAEVVALTVNLGQPGEDDDVVQGKALQLGRWRPRSSTRARSSRDDFVVPAIKANAIYGLGYPLFTALGRPLIAKLAVERAQARLRHDRPRLHRQGQRPGPHRGHGRDAGAPSSRSSRPCAAGRWGARRRSLRARARHPHQGRRRAHALPRSTTTSGRSSEGRWIEQLDHAPDDDVFQLVTRPEEAPDEPEVDGRLRARRARRAERRAAWGSSSCSSAPPRSARATASASSTTSRTASSA